MPAAEDATPAEDTPPAGRLSRRRGAAERVAVVLAVGMVLALNTITVALLWAAVHRIGIDVNAGLSDNGVQVLLAWGGGIISVLAAYVGYTFGARQAAKAADDEAKGNDGNG